MNQDDSLETQIKIPNLIKLNYLFSTGVMNTQLVESIVRLVNTLPPEERSLLKQRLLQDDRPQAGLNPSSDSIQLDQAQMVSDRPEWMAALHPWTQALVGVIQLKADETESYVDYLEEKYR